MSSNGKSSSELTQRRRLYLLTLQVVQFLTGLGLSVRFYCRGRWLHVLVVARGQLGVSLAGRRRRSVSSVVVVDCLFLLVHPLLLTKLGTAILKPHLKQKQRCMCCVCLLVLWNAGSEAIYKSE